MKKVLPLIAVMSVIPLAAEEQDICVSIAGMAETVMTKRQEGVDIIKMMEVAGTVDGLKEIAELLVIEAYKKPIFSTAAYKQESVSEFKTMVYLSCKRK